MHFTHGIACVKGTCNLVPTFGRPGYLLEKKQKAGLAVDQDCGIRGQHTCLSRVIVGEFSSFQGI